MTTEHSTTQDPDAGNLGDAGKRALDAERQARREAEKRARDAEMRLAEFERRDLVREVASAKGLDGALAERLRGSTKEELEADADEFLALVKPDEADRKARTPSGLPKERLRGGADPTDMDEPASGLVDRILGNGL